MTDNLTKAQRRKNMQNIRSENTLPELMVMKELRKTGIYFARHAKSIEGKPDIVFRKKKVLVFIDSDFWHFNKKKFTMPKSNVRYWKAKIKRNTERDKEVNSILRKSGWKVIRIWESNIKKNLTVSVQRIIKSLEK